MAEFITTTHNLPKNSSWYPVVGKETEDLLDYFNKSKGISQESCERLKDEAAKVLSKCGNPLNKVHKGTGLVFGYIQSGKTMSYTTLISLAKDNDYEMIILIAGTTVPLLNQTGARLKKDLRIEPRKDMTWKLFENPTIENKQEILTTVNGNRLQQTYPEEQKKTMLITVLKNTTRLRELTATLKSIDLTGVPTLIIDDEGDQASLNTFAKQNEKSGIEKMSRIYSRIIELKDSIPNHTLLQYTATPQGPFFIETCNALSPKFIELLTPGENYVGGREFFKNHGELIRLIPENEVHAGDEGSNELPETLMESMRIFFVCAAIKKLNPELIKSRNISMMVHPSHLTSKHNKFYTWITHIKRRWLSTFNESDDSLDKKELISDFKSAYEDVANTNKNLPSLDEVLRKIVWVLSQTEVRELNTTTKTNLVNWENNDMYILVGGQVMDRGFTVEGLIVTYMPRGIGTGNADTIQQRARFFGYKKEYISFCRVYLGFETKVAYENLLTHEENLRERIFEHNEKGLAMNDLKRQVELDPSLNPARTNVMRGRIIKTSIGGWVTFTSPHDSVEIIKNNRNVIETFIKKISWKQNEGHKKRTEMQKHEVIELPLMDALKEFLEKLKFKREQDIIKFTELIKALDDYSSDNKINCTIYRISQGKPRNRTLTKSGTVQLFEGAASVSNELVYPGDSEIKNSEEVSIQIYNLDIINKHTNEEFKNVYTVAVWIPREIGRDIQELAYDK